MTSPILKVYDYLPTPRNIEVEHLQRAPFRIWRDPTRKDVEELCEEKGLTLEVETFGKQFVKQERRFYAKPAGGVPKLIGIAYKGERPDWRSMLQLLGSDWA